MAAIVSFDSTKSVTESAALEARSQPLSFDNKVRKKVAEWYQCKPEEVHIEHLRTGLSNNRVFLVRAAGYEVVVKEFTKEQDFIDESSALALFAKLPLTKIHAVSQLHAGKISHDGKEVHLMAQSKAAGEPVLKTYDALTKKYVQVAEGLAELHTQDPVQEKADFRFLEADLLAITTSIMLKLEAKAQKGQVPSMLSLMPLSDWKRAIDTLWASVQANPGPAALVHGDPQPDNIFVSDSGVILIDNATIMKSVVGDKGKGSAARDYYYFVERADEQLFLAGRSQEERLALRKLFEEKYRSAVGDKMPSAQAMRFFDVRINLGIINKNLDFILDKKLSPEKIEPLLREKIENLNSLLSTDLIVRQTASAQSPLPTHQPRFDLPRLPDEQRGKLCEPLDLHTLKITSTIPSQGVMKYPIHSFEDQLSWALELYDISQPLYKRSSKTDTTTLMVVEGELTLHTTHDSTTLQPGQCVQIFPDSDFTVQPGSKGCRFISLDMPDLFPELPQQPEKGDSSSSIFIDQSVSRSSPNRKIAPLAEKNYRGKFEDTAMTAYEIIPGALTQNQFSIAVLDIVDVKKHYHNIGTERFIVLEGELQIELNGKPYVLKEGQSVRVSPGTRHALSSTSKTPVRVLCLNLPAFDPHDFCTD